MAHSFSKGDRVRFLHQAGEGLVVEVEDGGKTLLIEDSDGFPMRFAAKECLPMPNLAEEAKAYASKEITKGELLERNVDEHVLKASQKEFDVKYRNPDATNMRKRDEHMEVDLHFHALTGARDRATPHEMLTLQMEHFDRMMRRAEEKRIPRVIFIHGVGQGRLRQEIREALASFGRIAAAGRATPGNTAMGPQRSGSVNADQWRSASSRWRIMSASETGKTYPSSEISTGVSRCSDPRNSKTVRGSRLNSVSMDTHRMANPV